MKEFNLGKAKAGAPVCTRNGDKARILCYDMKDKNGYHILALIDCDGEEVIASYQDNGQSFPDPTEIRGRDLCMADVKREGWVLIESYEDDRLLSTKVFAALPHIYPSKEVAIQAAIEKEINYIEVAHIEWEE